MINPYEAPQTTAKLATREVPRLDPDLGVLQGAQYCARGGKFLMAAAISEFIGIGIVIWIQQTKQDGPNNLLNLGGWIFLSVSWLLLLIGAVLNLIGYGRFIRYLDHDRLCKLFRDCRRVLWIKIALFAMFTCCAFLTATRDVFAVAGITVMVILAGMIFHSYLAHARAMRIWSEHYPEPGAMKARNFYIVSGLTALVVSIGLVAFSFQQAQQPSKILLMGLMLLFALSFAAFADFYRRLSKALNVSEVEEIDSATAERDR